MTDDIRDRVQKLIALALNNPSEQEARSAAMKAVRLIQEHKLLAPAPVAVAPPPSAWPMPPKPQYYPPPRAEYVRWQTELTAEQLREMQREFDARVEQFFRNMSPK